MPRNVTASQNAARLAKLAFEADVKLLAVAKATGENTKRAVRAAFGDEDRLAPLKDETIARKAQMGYPNPEAPLIATGQLRDSVEVDIRPSALGFTVRVGSDDPKALYHELGTSRGIPPRPVFFEGALDAAESNLALLRVGASSILVDEPPAAAIVPKYHRDEA